jgi:hypothetical protein
MAKKPTKAETNTPFDKEFPEVRIAMDKAHNMLSKAFLGEVSLKEARVSVREANKAMREARKKMAARRRRHKKID